MTEEFAQIFSGFDGGYGTYVATGAPASSGKVPMVQTVTRRGRVTFNLWEDHLGGVKSLGIIPIDKDNCARWGAIDIDTYPVDHAELAATIAANHLPLVVCRSKSGGAHVFLFFKQPVAAGTMRAHLIEYASFLGAAKSEIFPKQTEVAYDQQDMGNWLNLPYFGGHKTDRYAYSDEGQPLSLQGFLELVRERITTPGTLRKEVAKGNGHDEAPPCLQVLFERGFPEGTRNKGMYNVGVFLKKAHEKTWKKKVHEYNDKYFHPPLPKAEVQTIVNSVAKKAYNYTCNDCPIQEHCNRAVCLTREYGISGPQAVKYSDLAKLDCDPPVYFLSVDGQRIRLTTGGLMDHRQVRKRTFEVLNRLPPEMAPTLWSDTLNRLLESLNIIDPGAIPGEEELARRGLLDFISRGTRKTKIDLKTATRTPVIVGNSVYLPWIRFVAFYQRQVRVEPAVLASLYTHLGVTQTEHPDVQHIQLPEVYVREESTQESTTSSGDSLT